MTDVPLDFQLLFEQSPDVLLVLLPDAPRYTMVAATEARFVATHTTRETLGQGLFEVFPDNPEDLSATGTNHLRTSLGRVISTRSPDTMAVQKYDIRGPDGKFETKYWSPKNLPVLSPTGELLYIIHRVEDVTELVRASELGEELRDRSQSMEREVIRRSKELAEANRDLHSANTKLGDANAKLGELDTAKTVFFSNVSHEFRTPLTLMLGPLDDALADASELEPKQLDRIRLAHDNALRLLKLVNTLLDFSRMEAGRLGACYVPVDIGTFTAELAGMFQSAAEKAGIGLRIDSAPMAEPAWVDRSMWEKVVPNLVSNAFKFTFEGEVSVSLREEPSTFLLEVRDTGVGIPEEELPRVFERFHRVAGTKGRTHEGTGIGLSLVRQLVELHGGSVLVKSEVDRGTTFRVEIPKGHAHLPPEAVSLVPVDTDLSRDVQAHVREVSRWTGSQPSTNSPPSPNHEPQSSTRAHVLVVDDNADLRRYITGLLEHTYDVTTASDGVEALDALRSQNADIVVSDVMMPRLDGFGLVRELRAQPSTRLLPVILLSARAGEELAIEGLDAGCDDYLVKPFSARELLARVRTHVNLAETRRRWISELELTNQELDAFSYSVSHDLRAPLRAISGFTRALAEDFEEVLDDRGRGYIHRAQQGVQRMTDLIDALLELARVTRSPMREEDVDLTLLASEVLADLQQRDPDRAVRVEIAEGMRARGDSRLMRVVFVNLVGNAWKFTAHCKDPSIFVGALTEDAPTFFVRDNGAGFDMAYAQRLFSPFQRLHDAQEFEGTGVGLATVRRVVARHHGRIWAESIPGEGATFFWTLPDAVTHSASTPPTSVRASL